MSEYNARMPAPIADYLEAIDSLPAGAILALPNIEWAEYESLLQRLTDRPGVRVTFDHGKLEVVSPSDRHERSKEFISRLVCMLGDELEIPVESFGSTTWKRRKLQKGTEPDACFYVGATECIVGKDRVDLETAPPPDIVVEVDISHLSVRKLSIYAAFGVPEVWRYDGKGVTMYCLKNGAYAESRKSQFLPLTCTALVKSLHLATREGHTAALKAFRQSIRQKRPSR